MAKGAGMMEWISVEDRLPESKEWPYSTYLIWAIGITKEGLEGPLVGGIARVIHFEK